jgi:NAD-dependent deacetylase
MSGSMPEYAEDAARLLKSATHAIAFTGAGISTESNIPDFRGTQGLWKRFDPKMASRTYFLEELDGFWKFYAKRYEYVVGAEPNKAHRALALLEEKGFIKSVITQNIDRLHMKAGSKSVLEIHGNIMMSRCDCCNEEVPTLEVIRRIQDSGSVPRCGKCKGAIRPSIVLFEEPADLMEMAPYIAYDSDLCLSVGSSLCVYPAAMVPEIVKRQGGHLIIINYDPTPLDGIADLVIREKASVALGAILNKIDSFP